MDKLTDPGVILGGTAILIDVVGYISLQKQIKALSAEVTKLSTQLDEANKKINKMELDEEGRNNAVQELYGTVFPNRSKGNKGKKSKSKEKETKERDRNTEKRKESKKKAKEPSSESASEEASEESNESIDENNIDFGDDE